MKATILIVDDHQSVRVLVADYLGEQGYRVLTASDGDEGLIIARRTKPDLVLLDVMMPKLDGFGFLQAYRRDCTAPVILLTARIEETDKVVGLELGADDYITKPFNPREVVARVRAVLRRASGPAVPATRLQHGDLSLDLSAHRATVAGTEIDLTPTEFDLLALLLRNPGHAFTRTELVEQGLGYAHAGLDRTIDSHIKNLRKKIERDPSAPPLIETVYGVGYRLR